MTNVERFLAALNGEKVDRLPIIEWAGWWNQTLERWYGEGLSRDIPRELIQNRFGLDPMHRFWFRTISSGAPEPAYNGAPLIYTEEDYENFKRYLYDENAPRYRKMIRNLQSIAPSHKEGRDVVWLSFDGFFWHPRALFGIENHLYSFYDEPELYHKICADLADFIVRSLPEIFSILTPEFVVISEDMSYNGGPMLSEAHFDEFLLPYYKIIVPEIKKYGVKIIVDSDGDISKMIPWFIRAGIDGVLPLERQAGVDIIELQKLYPDFIFLGGYNKMVMSKSEDDMRREFERLLPAMKAGKFLPSCDHQTPPEVSMENYKIYVELFKEYAQKACKCK
ncbi:MAG: hypothetical protein IJ344_02965 [Clostridia bacterium]|nr:hypothetical protein [Clostridia bacterium]